MLSAPGDEGSAGRPRGVVPALVSRTMAVLVTASGLALRLLRRLVAGALIIAAFAFGITYLALRNAPIELPAVARMAEHALNDGQSEVRIRIGSAVLALSRLTGRPAIRLREVEVQTADGDPVLTVPSLGARFSIGHLLDGEIRPTEILIRRPVARFVRGVDGRWHFGLGAREGAGFDLGGFDGAGDDELAGFPAGPQRRRGVARSAVDPALIEALAADEKREQTITRLLDSLSGEASAIPELQHLTAITVRDASLTYVNATSREAWSTEGATLRLRRDADGLTGVIGMQVEDGAADAPLRVFRVTARRARGTDVTEVDASLTGVRPDRLAAAVPELDWLALVDAPVDGILSGSLGDDGRLGPFSGEIIATDGRFVGAGGAEIAGTRFDALGIRFGFDPAAGRLRLDQMAVTAPQASLDLEGFIDLERNEERKLAGLAGQIRVGPVGLALPDIFADPVRFDSGEVVGRFDFSSRVIDIASARLHREALDLDVSGRVRLGGEKPEMTLRAEGRGISVADLKALWPVDRGRNARRWVVENLESGMIEHAVAQVRTGEGEPQVAVDFTFRDVVSRYLGDMPPIRKGDGMAHLRLDDFFLELDRGEVMPAEDHPVALDGSSLKISGLSAKVTTADITLKGRGRVPSVLRLIDLPPLGLVGKLGLDPASVSGETVVDTALAFPLIKELKLEEVAVRSEADLTDVRLPVSLPDGREVEVTADALRLEADTREMTVAGAVVADGIPAEVEWNEVYGGRPGSREIVARLSATPERLERFGASVPGFAGGSADVVARVRQQSGAALEAAIEADLGPARLAVPEIGWAKAPGSPGRLSVTATREGSGVLRLSALSLETGELSANGALALGPSGEIERVAFERLVLGTRVDLGIEASRVGVDGFAVTATGRHLDLDAVQDALGSPEGEGGAAPAGEGGARVFPDMTVDFDVASLVLTPRIGIEGARGRVRTSEPGGLGVDLEGAVNGEAPVKLRLVLPERGDGSLALDAPDAGAFLRATGLAEAARDGTMTVEATLRDGDLDRIEGTVRMANVTLREAMTFERMLNQGGVSRPRTVESGGLGFAEVVIPFDYVDGTITLGTSIATGPALAVKLDGTIEESGQLDLSGVISPAYALTGALNNIPVLGQILTGGRGEGILAMTFSVGGTIEEPSFSVNPLSLLAPGFLRKIFTSKGRKPDQEFLDQLGPPE